MSSSKQGGDLYRPIIKEGTHLAPSKKTPGAYRGTQLSDANNQVDGQTEWIKVDEIKYEYSNSPYEYEDQREAVELTEEQRKMAALIGEAIAAGTLWVLSEVVAPHVKKWWQEKAAPGIKKAWQGISEKKPHQKGKSRQQLYASRIIEVRETAPNLFTQELDEAYGKYMNDMTSEEAQRELLDIFILSAVVAAKMRKLAHARIVKDGMVSLEYIKGNDVIAKLSTPQFVNSINRILENNPNLLEEKSIPLSAILGRTLVVEGRFLPIESEVLRAAFANTV
jgi:hypothetical protein